MSITSTVAIADDAVYAGVIASLTSLITEDPAMAAGFAVGVVLLIRALGFMLLQAGKYWQARARQIDAETRALEKTQEASPDEGEG